MEELELEREIFAEVTAWRTAERQTSAVSGPFYFQTCIYDTCLNFFLSWMSFLETLTSGQLKLGHFCRCIWRLSKAIWGRGGLASILSDWNWCMCRLIFGDFKTFLMCGHTLQGRNGLPLSSSSWLSWLKWKHAIQFDMLYLVVLIDVVDGRR